MLKEIPRVVQHEEGRIRRVFRSTDLDLTLWIEADGGYASFELSVRHGPRERSLRWKSGTGYSHHRVDDGEIRMGRHKGTPLMVPDGVFNRWAVVRKFQLQAGNIDPEVTDFVIKKVIAFGAEDRR
jgi:hypothetical protein